MKNFEFSVEELEYQKIIKNNSSDGRNTVASFKGFSEPITQLKVKAPQNIVSLILARTRIQNEYKTY